MIGRSLGIAFVSVAVALMAAAPARAIEANDFYQEFVRNEAAFQQKYVKRNVSVSGEVGIINIRLAPGRVSLRVQGGSAVIHCLIDDRDKPRIGSLAIGQRATVSGTVLRVGPEGVLLQPCTF